MIFLLMLPLQPTNLEKGNFLQKRFLDSAKKYQEMQYANSTDHPSVPVDFLIFLPG